MLRRATRLWHGSDSNVVPLPCQTKFIDYINVFWRDCVRARSYEETTKTILLYGVCALNVTRGDIRSKNTTALQVALNVPRNKPEGCLGHTECLPKPGITVCIL